MVDLEYECTCGYHGQAMFNPMSKLNFWICLKCGRKIPEPELSYRRGSDRVVTRGCPPGTIITLIMQVSSQAEPARVPQAVSIVDGTNPVGFQPERIVCNNGSLKPKQIKLF